MARTITPKHLQESWLNRNVVGMAITSLLSDANHEMATAILPGFLAVLGLSPAVLGLIEGVADSTSSFVKLGSGWLSDRLGHRKPPTVGGYFLTGFSQAIFAFASGLPLLLVGRTLGWFGRGVRAPLRNAMLAESVPAEARGKAFGFHRAGDTIGAIIGPLLGIGLLAAFHGHTANVSQPYRVVFLLTLIPGIGSGITFAALVREKRRATAPTRLWSTIRALPGPFWRFLCGAGIFGAGDFARTLMILAATELLSPRYGVVRATEIAGLVYVVHNVLYAACSYPVGALSDRAGRRGLLALGYIAGALASLGFLTAFVWKVSAIGYLLALFAIGGFSIAAVDALEGAATADFIDESIRGTVYGVLGVVNGAGDLAASLAVGALWTAVSPASAFGYAAAMMGLGGVVMYGFR